MAITPGLRLVAGAAYAPSEGLGEFVFAVGRQGRLSEEMGSVCVGQVKAAE